MRAAARRHPKAAPRHVRVEHPHAGPVGLALFDELQVAGVLLILVLRGAGFEHDVQADVKLLVVHLAQQVGRARADAEIDRARVRRQIFTAGGELSLDAGGRTVFEREIDHVSKHRARSSAIRRLLVNKRLRTGSSPAKIAGARGRNKRQSWNFRRAVRPGPRRR